METKEKIEEFLSSEKYKVKTDMCKIFKDSGSDKSTYHNYTPLYDCLFSDFVGKEINFFELGLGTNNTDVPSNMGEDGVPGASLYAFRTYLENANICGADIDTRVLFEDDNIWTFYVDQRNPEAIEELWSSFEDTKFDIIIDDGLHAYSANKIFFDNSIHMLAEGGFYIIEDILLTEKDQFVNYFKEKDFSYVDVIELPMDSDWDPDTGRVNTADNCVLVIQK